MGNLVKARESEVRTVTIAIEKESGDYNGLDVNLKVRIFNISGGFEIDSDWMALSANEETTESLSVRDRHSITARRHSVTALGRISLKSRFRYRRGRRH